MVDVSVLLPPLDTLPALGVAGTRTEPRPSWASASHGSAAAGARGWLDPAWWSHWGWGPGLAGACGAGTGPTATCPRMTMAPVRGEEASALPSPPTVVWVTCEGATEDQRGRGGETFPLRMDSRKSARGAE